MVKSNGLRVPLGLAVVVVAASFIGLLLVRLQLLFALVAPAMLGVMGLVALVRLCGQWREDPTAHRRLLMWTLLGFSLHLLFGLVLSVAVELETLAPDAGTYHRHALRIVQHWTADFPVPRLPSGKEGYYYLLAGVYRMFGPFPVAGLVVNSILAAALVPLVSDLTRRLFNSEAARYVPPLVVLLPGLFLWTSLLLKEAAIVFLIAVVANCAVRLADRTTARALLILTCGLALLLTFRASVALALTTGLIASLAVGRRQLVEGVSVGLSSLSLIGLIVLASGVGYTGYQTAVSSNLEQANVVRQDLVRSAQSGFAAEVDISDPQRAIRFLPRGLFHMMLGPLPWQLGSARQLLVIPEVITWWLLLPSLWRGVRSGWRAVGRQLFVLLLPAATMSVLLALVLGNFGILSRERVQVVVLLVPVISLGLSVRASRATAAQDEPAEGFALTPAPSPAAPGDQPAARSLTVAAPVGRETHSAG